MSYKPNDSGIDLKDANLDSDSAPQPAPAEPAPAPVPEPEVMRMPEPDLESEPDISGPSPKELTIASEDRVARRKLILCINSYYASVRFGAFLKKAELVEDLASLTIPEMTNLLQDIKFCVQNRSSSKMIHSMVPQLIHGLEPIISTVYDITGLAQMLVRDEDFKDVLEEVALESQVFTNTPPTTRLMYHIAKSAWIVNMSKGTPVPEKKVDAGKYSDVM